MIQLGDKVRDRVTGFEGLALARMESLYEANQLRIHPQSLNSNDGQMTESKWIDEGRLILVKQGETSVGFGVKR